MLLGFNWCCLFSKKKDFFFLTHKSYPTIDFLELSFLLNDFELVKPQMKDFDVEVRMIKQKNFLGIIKDDKFFGVEAKEKITSTSRLVFSFSLSIKKKEFFPKHLFCKLALSETKINYTFLVFFFNFFKELGAKNFVLSFKKLQKKQQKELYLFLKKTSFWESTFINLKLSKMKYPFKIATDILTFFTSKTNSLLLKKTSSLYFSMYGLELVHDLFFPCSLKKAFFDFSKLVSGLKKKTKELYICGQPPLNENSFKAYAE